MQEEIYLFIFRASITFKKIFLLLLLFTLQYCIGFAMHQHASTMCVHENQKGYKKKNLGKEQRSHFCYCLPWLQTNLIIEKIFSN